MRVMHLIGSLKLGGAEKVVSILAQAFNKERCAIYVLAFETGDLEKECRRGGAKVIIMPFKWWNLLPWLYHFVKELRGLKIDVLHTHLFTTDLLGRIGGRLAGIPVVVSTIHAPSTWKKSDRLKDKIKVLMDRVTANYLCDSLFSISKKVSDFQVEHGRLRSSKMSIISNPIMIYEYEKNGKLRNITRASIGLDDEHKVLTNVASLKPVKGQKYLIEAMKKLEDKYPNIRLLLVGNGEDTTTLRRLTDSLDISANVLFLGNRLDVPELLAASDIFVMPSLSEGISVAILEAMASELPIVATSVGGNRDIIEDGVTGLLVNPADASMIAKAVERLLNDTEYSRLLGKRAKQYVKAHHDADTIAGQLENSYRALYQRKISSKNSRRD